MQAINCAAQLHVFVDIITFELLYFPALVPSYSLRRSYEALAGWCDPTLTEGPSTLSRPVDPSRFAPHPAEQAQCSSSAIASIFVTKSGSIFEFQPGYMHSKT